MTTCALCSREIELDLTIRVDLYGIGPVDVCIFCVEKADLEEGAA